MRPIDADALTAWMIGELRMIPNGVFNAVTGRQAANLIGMAIDEAPTVKMPGWIRVEDRLPEETGRYLCCFGKNVIIKGVEIVMYVAEWKAFGSVITEERYPNVTHWMPLPVPPEDKPDGYRIGGVIEVTADMLEDGGCGDA